MTWCSVAVGMHGSEVYVSMYMILAVVSRSGDLNTTCTTGQLGLTCYYSILQINYMT